MKFIGIDLAWSLRNPTGAAVLEGDSTSARLLETQVLSTDEEILAFIDHHAALGPAVVAIDAPLIVPNEAGRRPAEVEVGAIYSRYQAGAHSANRTRLADSQGRVRGEELVRALAAKGFDHDPVIPAAQPVRRVVEVYPHPAMIALFNLPVTLKYKAKRGRSAEQLRAAWRTYHEQLRKLQTATPALTDLDALLDTDVDRLIGKGLKRHEDQVDAVMCAYIALYAHAWGEARTEVLGTMTGGYILTPTLAQAVR